MKKFTLIAIAALSAFATAATQQNTIVKKAALNICPVRAGRPVALGCRDSLQISPTKRVYFDLHTSASKEVENCFNSVIGANRFQQVSRSQAFEVEGYITKEKGLFPNPGVEFEVFHIVDSKDICNVPVPK